MRKFALRRSAKEFLKKVIQQKGYEGFPRWHAQRARTTESGSMIDSLRDYKYDHGLPNIKGLRDLKSLNRATAKNREAWWQDTSGVSPRHRIDDIKRRWSGFHAPRKGEVLIPAGPHAEMAAFGNTPPNANVLFRGNPPRKGEFTYMSRHPDVAAAYAAAPEALHASKPSGKLLAFARPTKSVGEIETAYRASKHPKQLFKDRNATAQYNKDIPEMVRGQERDMIRLRLDRLTGKTTGPFAPGPPLPKLQGYKHVSQLNPSYETIFPRNVTPKQLGQYTVRPSRTAQGLPAYAVKDVEGMPASEAFAEFLKRKPVIY